jgi:MFS family permease
MYAPSRSLLVSATRGAEDGAEARPATRRISPNVIALGVTSMFTDISSEMVNSVLPLYLSLLFGFGPAAFGGFDGVYQAMAAIACVGAALLADRRRRHKEVAGFGYALSAACKLGLIAASGSWVPALGVLYADRFGKGIRTAPRDALISLSSAKARLAENFGVHRAFDTVGAVVGPVLASLILARDPSGYRSIFVVSFFVAVIGVAALVLFVDGRPKTPDPEPAPVGAESASTAPLSPELQALDESLDASLEVPATDERSALGGDALGRQKVSWRDAAALLRLPRYRAVCLVATVLAVMTPGDALIYLTFTKRADLGVASFPLLYVGASIVFLVAAVPLGRLADRVGSAKVFIGGELAMLGVFALLATGAGSLPALALLLVFLGGYYAATDGVLMALASTVVPARVRASGLALLMMVIAIGHLVASAVFGVLWQTVGSVAASQVFVVGLLGAIVCSALVLRSRPAAAV